MIASIAERVHFYGKEKAEALALAHLNSELLVNESCTYRQLDSDCRRLAYRLIEAGCRGKAVIVLVEVSTAYVKAVLACFYAGAIAVPVVPGFSSRSLSRITSVVEDSKARTIISSVDLRDKVCSINRDYVDLQWICIDDEEGFGLGLLEKPGNGFSAAMIQYTSGSTSRPKGVVVSNENLSHNQNAIKNAFRHCDGVSVFSWLPPYHDMGLIGSLFQPLFLGGICRFVSPYEFVRDPLIWLRAISKFRPNTSGGPDYAYRFCVEKSEDVETAELDLSSWNIAFNGSEPIRKSTMDLFAEKFGRCGFRKTSFVPCYGLAEATLIVSSKVNDKKVVTINVDRCAFEENKIELGAAGEGERLELVSSGEILPGFDLVVVDSKSDDRVLAEGQVGEICLRGDSVSAGYWKSKTTVEDSFVDIRLNNVSRRYLRTGDLGFVRGGQLFVTGRRKNLVILNGKNVYLHDIEDVVIGCDDNVVDNGVAAVCFDGGDRVERLLVLAEVKRVAGENLLELRNLIKKSVFAAFGLGSVAVYFTRKNLLPKTTSGKMRREECLRLFLEKSLKIVELESEEKSRTHSDAALSQELRDVVVSELGISCDEICSSDRISDYFIDSIAIVRLIHALEKRFSISLSFENVVGCDHFLALDSLLNRSSVDTIVEGDELQESRVLDFDESQVGILYDEERFDDPSGNLILRLFSVTGDLNLGSLCRAFDAVIDRYEEYRMSYDSKNKCFKRGEFTKQQILEVVVLSNRNSNEGVRALFSRLVDDYPLASGQLLKVKVYSESGGRLSLMIAAHHIAYDYLKLKLLYNRLNNELKGGSMIGIDHLLSESSVPLPRKHGAHSNVLKNAKHYWSDALRGYKSVRLLKGSSSFESKHCIVGKRKRLKLDREESARVFDAAAGANLSLFKLLVSVYCATIGKFTGKDDVIVGVPFLKKDSVGRETVGSSVNVLPIRAKVNRDQRLMDFWGAVGKAVDRAVELSNVSFQDVALDANTASEDVVADCYNNLFVFLGEFTTSGSPGTIGLDQGPSAFRLGNGQLEEVFLDQRKMYQETFTTVAVNGGSITIDFEFNNACDHHVCRSLLECYKNMLCSLPVGFKNAKIGDLRMLTKEGASAVISRFALGEKRPIASDSICDRFNASVEKFFDRKAVVSEDMEITYGELDQLSDQLGRFLEDERGVKPGDTLVVSMGHSPWLIVSIFAILKVGGNYLPVKVGTPSERMSEMVNAVGAKYLLVEDPNTSTAGYAYECIVIDEHFEFCRYERRGGAVYADGSSLAYTIFTSGSTGKPKGIQISHRSVCNLIDSVSSEIGMGPSSRTLQVLSIGFDVSVWEIFTTLLGGGELHQIKMNGGFDFKKIEKSLSERKISILNMTPSMLSRIEPVSCVDLKTVMVIGEMCSENLIKTWKTEGRRFINAYGPAEATVAVSMRVDPKADRPANIGFPFQNTGIYILDENDGVCPVGVEGQICISGEHLASNLVQEDLYSGKFVTVVERHTGKRIFLYKTGDRGLWSGDGSIDIGGRLDREIKVRGFRVAPEEVEAKLMELEPIERAEVYKREGKDYLSSVLLLKREKSVSRKEVFEHLAKHLPLYMVPKDFRVLEGEQLSGNLKSNLLEALPRSTSLVDEVCSMSYSPKNAIELSIVTEWKRMLEVEEVDYDATFYELGLNSFMLTEFVALMQSKYDINIKIIDLYEYPTLRKFVEKISLTDQSTAVPTMAGGRGLERRAVRGRNRR